MVCVLFRLKGFLSGFVGGNLPFTTLGSFRVPTVFTSVDILVDWEGNEDAPPDREMEDTRDGIRGVFCRLAWNA